MPKATIELEIPDGYEFDRYDVPNRGEYILYCDEASEVQSKLSRKHIIVRKVEPVTELAVRFKPGWIAMDEDCKWYWFSEKPDVNEDIWDSVSVITYVPMCVSMPAVTDWKQSLMRVG